MQNFLLEEYADMLTSNLSKILHNIGSNNLVKKVPTSMLQHQMTMCELSTKICII
jgi:hypothetical protein